MVFPNKMKKTFIQKIIKWNNDNNMYYMRKNKVININDILIIPELKKAYIFGILKEKLKNKENQIKEIRKVVIKESKYKDMNEINNSIKFSDIINSKNNKILQDKYLKMVSERRLKPQRDLLEQAKEMRIRKLERDQNNLSFMINLNKKKNLNKSSISNNDKSYLNDNSILPPINSSQNIVTNNNELNKENNEEKNRKRGINKILINLIKEIGKEKEEN